MSFRIYVENLSSVASTRILYTFRGATIQDLETELRSMLAIPVTVHVEIYDRRFGASHRQRVVSLETLPADHDALYVFLRKGG
jgi:hypothetical protein